MLTPKTIGGGKNEPLKCGSEGEPVPVATGDTSWSYMFVHHTKVDKVRIVLTREFNVFIHTRIAFKRKNKSVKEEERPTIAGLIFVQGDSRKIQKFLKDNLYGLYLVKDCSTGHIATISDDVMRSFMQLSQVSPTRIRFMPHPFDYYSRGNSLIKITSGVLSGMEGYRIRIARDKCFITTIGGMTVAIGGIYKENFENADEYVRQRRLQLKRDEMSPSAALTQIQSEIDKGFLNPENQLDVLMVAQHVSSWTERAEQAMKSKDYDCAVEITLFLLEEIGSRFQSAPDSLNLKEITLLCKSISNIIDHILGSTEVSTDLKEILETGRESLEVRFAFLPL